MDNTIPRGDGGLVVKCGTKPLRALVRDVLELACGEVTPINSHLALEKHAQLIRDRIRDLMARGEAMTHPTDTRLPTREELEELRSACIDKITPIGWISAAERALCALPALLAAAERALELEAVGRDSARWVERAEERTEITEASLTATQERCSQLEAERDGFEKKWRSILAAEHKLSDAYVRLRRMLNAWGTPECPSPEQIYAHTEERLAAVIRDLDETRAERDRAVAADRERVARLFAFWWHDDHAIEVPFADLVREGKTEEQLRRELEGGE